MKAKTTNKTSTTAKDCRDSANCLPPAEISAQGIPLAVDTQLAQLAKALGHPARVQILRLLLSRRACVCGEICNQLPLAQSTVSQHLKVLRQAGLVTVEEQGNCTCYYPDPSRLQQLQQLIGDLSQLQP